MIIKVLDGEVEFDQRIIDHSQLLQDMLDENPDDMDFEFSHVGPEIRKQMMEKVKVYFELVEYSQLKSVEKPVQVEKFKSDLESTGEFAYFKK